MKTLDEFIPTVPSVFNNTSFLVSLLLLLLLLLLSFFFVFLILFCLFVSLLWQRPGSVSIPTFSVDKTSQASAA